MDKNEERKILEAAIIAAMPELSLDELRFIYSYITAP